MFKISLQLFLEQLESALQGNETSIRCQWPVLLPWNFDSRIVFYCGIFSCYQLWNLAIYDCILTIIFPGCSHDELVLRSRDQSISDYGEWCLYIQHSIASFCLYWQICLASCYVFQVCFIRWNTKAFRIFWAFYYGIDEWNSWSGLLNL